MDFIFDNLDAYYGKAYKVYKLLPAINAAVILFCAFVFGIVDAFAWVTSIGWDLEIAAMFIWWIIGAIAAAIVFVSTTLMISPTIVRTNAALKYSEEEKAAE